MVTSCFPYYRTLAVDTFHHKPLAQTGKGFFSSGYLNLMTNGH